MTSVPPRLMLLPGLVVTICGCMLGGVVTMSLSPTLCRSVLDERFIWIAFGISDWNKALGRKALSTGRLTPIPDLGACVVSGSRLGSALRCGGVRLWAVSLLWCPPIPLAVSSARRIFCRSRALCTPARMSSRTRLRLSSRVLASVAALELACGESAEGRLQT